MAKANRKMLISLNLMLMISLAIFISMAESRALLARKKTAECETVVGVESGDTCFHIAEIFGLTTEFFDSINPNLDCDALFVGQWVCIDGFVH